MSKLALYLWILWKGVNLQRWRFLNPQIIILKENILYDYYCTPADKIQYITIEMKLFRFKIAGEKISYNHSR
jgi:hypothetical protein